MGCLRGTAEAKSHLKCEEVQGLEMSSSALVNVINA